MKNTLKIEIDKLIKKDFFHFLLANIFLLLGLLIAFASAFWLNIKASGFNGYYFIFPLMLPFVFSIFVIYRYFNLFGDRNGLKNKMLIKILLVNIIIVFLIGISFLFWSFLVPSFSLQYKKVSGDNKKNIEKIIDIFKWIIISLSIIDIPIAILNISISAYYFKNTEKIIKE